MADLPEAEAAGAVAVDSVATTNTTADEHHPSDDAAAAEQATSTAATVTQDTLGPTLLHDGSTLLIGEQTFSNLTWSPESDGFIAVGSCGNQFLIKREFLEENGLLEPATPNTAVTAEEQLETTVAAAEKVLEENNTVDNATSTVTEQLAQTALDAPDQKNLTASSYETDLLVQAVLATASSSTLATSDHLLANSTPADFSGLNSKPAVNTTNSQQNQNENRRDLSPTKKPNHLSSHLSPVKNDKSSTLKTVEQYISSAKGGATPSARALPTKSTPVNTSSSTTDGVKTPSQQPTSASSTTPAINDNFIVKTNNHLVSSTKNYSKKLSNSTSSLVWITPESRNGNSSNDESSNVLTTTIEISETPSDDDEDQAMETEQVETTAKATTLNNKVKSPQRGSPRAAARKNSELSETVISTPTATKLSTAVNPVVVAKTINISSRGKVSIGGSIMKSPPRVPPATSPLAPSIATTSSTNTTTTKQAKDVISEPANVAAESSPPKTISQKRAAPDTETDHTLDSPLKTSRKSVSFEMDRLPVTTELDTYLQLGPGYSRVNYMKGRETSRRVILPSKFYRSAPSRTPSSEYSLEEISSRPMKETRSAEHFNDVVKGTMVIHTRIQSQPVGLDMYTKKTAPYTCPKCGLQMLFTKSRRIHLDEGCTGKKGAFNKSLTSKKGAASQQNGLSGRRVGSSQTTPKKRNIPMKEVDDFDVSIDDDESEDEEDDGDDGLSDTVESFEGFTEKSVVWVETKLGLWPALIEQVIVIQRKLMITLFDHPHKRNSYKVKMSKATLYDAGFSKKRQWKETPQMLKAVSNAEKYMRSLCLVDKKEVVGKVRKASGTGEASTSSAALEGAQTGAEQAVPSTSSQDGVPPGSEQAGKEGEETEPSIKLDKARIVSFIKEGQCEGYLCGVYKKTTESIRLKKYFEAIEAGETPDGYTFGPITEEGLQDELYDCCSVFFKSTFNQEEVKDDVSFVLNVFIPEAIIKAISKLYQVDMNEAENVYNFYSAEHLKNLNNLDKSEKSDSLDKSDKP